MAAPAISSSPESRSRREARPLGLVGSARERAGRKSPRCLLPAQPTPLIGRETEIAALRDLLWRADSRLITLLGPGGIGKTRLAVAAAEQVRANFADGIAFIDLAALDDLAAVPATIVANLELRRKGRQSSAEILHEAMREWDFLLILDNCEHLPGLAQLVGDLLAACPALMILATSRAPLHLRWEQRFPVAALALPRSGEDQARLAAVPSVALFLERARATVPSFSLTTENAAAIAKLCVDLDGLPLAIEMAAARVSRFSPQVLLARLGARLDFLRSTQADHPARHRTLEATIAWSYDRLDEDTRAIFRRLAIFADGCSLAAAAAVCISPDADASTFMIDDLAERLAALVEQSLLVIDDEAADEPRYRMLVSIREFALKELVAADESQISARRQADYLLSLAEEAATHLHGARQLESLAILAPERENLRSVLAWSIERGECAIGLRLGAALWWGWYLRGEFREGLHWLMPLLALDGGAELAARARCQIGAGTLAYQIGDVARASELGEAGTALARRTGDHSALHMGLNLLGGLAIWRSDFEGARAYLGEALELYRREELRRPVSTQARFFGSLALTNLGTLALERGEFTLAREQYEEGLRLARQLGNRQGVAQALARLGETLAALGERARGAALIAEAATLFTALGDGWGEARAQLHLARLAVESGRLPEAARSLAAGARFSEEAQVQLGLVLAWEVAAALAARRGHWERTARLLGGVATLRAAIGSAPTAIERAASETLAAQARDQLGPAAFLAAWREGERRERDAQMADLRSETDPGPAASTSRGSVTPITTGSPVRLTRREQELLPFLARGIANRAIAEQLSISARTVEMHIANLLGKLELENRAQIAAWASQNGLAGEQDASAV